MIVHLATLAARIAETDLVDGQPPACSVISPAGAREVTGPGSITQQFLEKLPEPALLPELNFNKASGTECPTVVQSSDLNLGQTQ